MQAKVRFRLVLEFVTCIAASYRGSARSAAAAAVPEAQGGGRAVVSGPSEAAVWKPAAGVQ